MTSVDCSQPQTKTIRTSGRVSRQSEKLSVTGGSKKSFWIRPSSALYEMTASTAAKCTSKVDETRVSSVHSRPPTRVNSPRNSGVSPRPSSTAIRRGSAVSEVSERPPIKKSTASARSSSSAAKPLKRKASVNNSSVFERLASSTTSATENRVNNTTAVNTFDTSSSPSVSKKRSSSKMTRQASTKSGVESSSNKLTRRPSTATGLTSNAVVSSRASSTTTSARPSTAVASTADRQSESFRKHCERVAARNAAKEAEKAHDPELKFQRQRSSQMSLKKKKTEEGKVIHKVRRSSSLGVKSETPKQPVVKTVTPQTPPARLSGTISKKLLFEIHDDAADEEEPCPLSAAPRASERPPLPSALVGTPIPVPRKSAPRDDQPNHHSPIKSVKREGDKEASPCREELQKQEEEDAKVTTAAAALAAARQAYNARKQARTSTGSAPRLSANTSGDLLTAVLQGVAQQTRRVIPCYYCAEMQNVGTYKVHLDVCEGRSHTLLRDRGVSEEQLQQALEKVKELPIPSLVSEEGERETFTYAAFLCAKTLLVKCSKCQTSVRVHDVKEHELLCGRSYYVGSKAEQRLREAVDRIQEGTSDSNESSKKF
ncbi:dentin sialophosphoprotein precursor [Angomonas deanei]|uniref:Uncharacterized protein n=1 Tax=Angomonas deanei TaxID=59799 RepID=A0A7G2C8L6_9TRYP|nr:dentin sialophosphoprotein precursor [Angomonas deanei]CAD2216126.1 hypothetical protein, conserved [Angomonas deanei]|eukprot:EPY18327.1 dentin sialophosphoprotein precursor [Angomonas deanei]